MKSLSTQCFATKCRVNSNSVALRRAASRCVALRRATRIHCSRKLAFNQRRNYCFFCHVNHFLGLGVFEAVFKTPWYCAVGMVVSLLPQIYWFKLMFRGAVKMIAARQSESKLKRN
jgi:hypothetical protein